MVPHEQNQTMILQDGRLLGFAVYGPSAGQPVFYFHGSGSSRLEHPLEADLLAQLNIRFISVDRPGNGLSDFQADRRLIDWAKDIVQLAGYLEIEQFHVVGHSAGGPHALACAHQLPGRVIAGAVISSVAPMNRPHAYQGMPLMNQLLARSARHFPVLVKLIRWKMRQMVMADFNKSSNALMSSLPETDKLILDDQQNAKSFEICVREGFRSGSIGVAQDDILINRKWGFNLAEIGPRMDIWHGDADVNVPVSAARYLCDQLPQARLTTFPGEGHFFLLKYWGRILTNLVYDSRMDPI